METQPWSVPRVLALRGGHISWRTGVGAASTRGGGYRPWDTVAADPRLLASFLRLEDAPAERIHGFAKRWGPLKLCAKHRLPETHLLFEQSFREGQELVGKLCPPAPMPGRRQHHQRGGFGAHVTDTWWEPVDGWRELAGRARALLAVAAEVRAGARPSPDEWDRAQLEVFGGDQDPQPNEWSIQWWRVEIAAEVTRWLQVGAVRPSFTWQWGVLFSSATPGPLEGSLFGALAAQLAQRILEPDPHCRACGVVFKARKPQQRYCGKRACRRAQARANTRNSRERRAQEA